MRFKIKYFILAIGVLLSFSGDIGAQEKSEDLTIINERLIKLEQGIQCLVGTVDERTNIIICGASILIAFIIWLGFASKERVISERIKDKVDKKFEERKAEFEQKLKIEYDLKQGNELINNLQNEMTQTRNEVKKIFEFALVQYSERIKEKMETISIESENRFSARIKEAEEQLIEQLKGDRK